MNRLTLNTAIKLQRLTPQIQKKKQAWEVTKIIPIITLIQLPVSFPGQPELLSNICDLVFLTTAVTDRNFSKVSVIRLSSNIEWALKCWEA